MKTVMEIGGLQFLMHKNTTGSKEQIWPFLFLQPLLLHLCARHGVISSILPMKRLDFHRPADLLTAGVSRIQFQAFFHSFQDTSQLTILLSAYLSTYQVLNKG